MIKKIIFILLIFIMIYITLLSKFLLHSLDVYFDKGVFEFPLWYFKEPLGTAIAFFLIYFVVNIVFGRPKK